MLKAFLVPHPPLIVPGVGDGGEIPATRAAYEKIAAEIEGFAPETAIYITPHSIMYQDYIHISPGGAAAGDMRGFRAKDISFSVEYDEELADRVAACAQEAGVPAGFLGERDPKLDHGVMVPLHFFHSKRIVRISLSGLPLTAHYRFGMCIRRASEDISRRVAIIASGDMSHKLKDDGPYGFAKEGPIHDKFVRECLEDLDFRKLMTIDPNLCEGAAECGLRSIVMMAGAMDGMEISGKVLSYEGPFGVGYMTAEFTASGSSPSLLPLILDDVERARSDLRGREDAYVRLAREGAEHFVRTGKPLKTPHGLPDELYSAAAGVFVSIKKDGALRGCIGTITPAKKNIAEEILSNCVSAAIHDNRFDPVAEDELETLTYSVDVLSPPEPISGPEGLDTERYGVIVSAGHKRGLLLPNLEGVDTVEEQIDIARRKGGISPNEPYSLERFEVIRHKP